MTTTLTPTLVVPPGAAAPPGTTPALPLPTALPLATALPQPTAVPDPTTTDLRTPASGLPVARTADPDGCGTLLTITVEDHGRSAALRVRGEIDMMTTSALGAALDERLASGAGTIVVDLRDVWFVACAGIALLADARRRAALAGIRLRIVAGRPIARTAALLGLTAALGLSGREHG